MCNNDRERQEAFTVKVLRRSSNDRGGRASICLTAAVALCPVVAIHAGWQKSAGQLSSGGEVEDGEHTDQQTGRTLNFFDQIRDARPRVDRSINQTDHDLHKTEWQEAIVQNAKVQTEAEIRNATIKLYNTIYGKLDNRTQGTNT